MITIRIPAQIRGEERTNVKDLNLGFVRLSSVFQHQFDQKLARAVRGITLEKRPTVGNTRFFPIDLDLSQEDIEEFRIASATQDLSRYTTKVHKKAQSLVDLMVSQWVAMIRDELAVFSEQNPGKAAAVTAVIEGADTVLNEEILPVNVFLRDYADRTPQLQVETSVNFVVTEAEVKQEG
ncbi:hypothetical protein KASHIRA_00160 [Serratia phage vB_SmaM-Kashira]|nr:hypothetical protein [Acinetobacter phage ABPH49]URC22610.1 hypothetical protein KASHIRA_00160 [Serratia phage vB_SmaM-Kashira]